VGVWDRIQEVLSKDLSGSVVMEEIIKSNVIIQDRGIRRNYFNGWLVPLVATEAGGAW
jgi:hypothetical protein